MAGAGEGIGQGLDTAEDSSAAPRQFTGSELANELAALEAKYPSELKKNGTHSIALHLAAHGVVLRADFPDMYPAQSPHIRLGPLKKLRSPKSVQVVEKRLQADIDKYAGQVVVFRLIDTLVDLLAPLDPTAPAEEPEGRPRGRQRGGAQGKASPSADRRTASKGPAAEPAQSAAAAASEKKSSMRTAMDVVHRVQWDDAVEQDLITIGYEDRFTGIQERVFSEFNWADYASLSHLEVAIPKHRIVFFKYRSRIVWDKRVRLDDIFGSTGGLKLMDVIRAENAAATRTNLDIEVQAAFETVSSSAADDEDGDAEYEDSEDSTTTTTTTATTTSPAPAVKGPPTAKDRPNYFVCVRLTAKSIVRVAQDVQERVVAYDPRLAPGCLGVNGLHITLVTCRLDSAEEVAVARAAMDACRSLMQECLADPIQVVGVDCFRDRVVHATVSDASAQQLGRLAKGMLRVFEQNGVQLVGNRPEFTPHMTLAKLSRALVREVHHIGQGAYLGHVDADFGSQRLDEMHLCEMSHRVAEDSFYIRLHTTCMRPTLSVDACAQALATAARKAPTAVIMRGLPGSGKSSLIARLARLDVPAVVCSADAFFTTADGYNWDAALLGDAHAASRQTFADALAAKSGLVVVDNTNSTRREYHSYAEAARAAGYQVRVVEFKCQDARQCLEFCRRSRHEVPEEAAERMFQRWQADRQAILVQPWRQPPAGSDGSPDSDSSSLALGLAVEPATSFSAVFLTRESREKLLAAASALHATLFADHVTLCFSPPAEQIALLPIGQTVAFQVAGIASDAAGQAAAVVLPAAAGVTSVNAHPHVTISTAVGTGPQYSNQLLATAPTIPLPVALDLEGVVGIGVHEAGRRQKIVSLRDLQLMLKRKAQPTVCPEGEDGGRVTALHVFDFDGTLFLTPGAEEGKLAYWQHFQRSWDLPGFVTQAASLEHPMEILPGPVLPLYRKYMGRSGSRTVVMSGRVRALEPQVRRVLTAFGIAADEVLLKPTKEEDTVAFKVAAMADLLRQHPGVTSIEVWDDLPENLAALEAWGNTLGGAVRVRIHDAVRIGAAVDRALAEVASPISRVLRERGQSRHAQFVRCAQDALAFVAEAWRATLATLGVDVSRIADVAALVRPFGSFLLARESDVDLLLLAAAERGNIWSWLGTLEGELRKRGVTLTYLGESTRCPRLVCQLAFRSYGPIEFDLLVARVPESRLLAGTVPSAAALARAHEPGDAMLAAALDGPAFWEPLPGLLADHGVPLYVAADTVTFVQQLLRVAGLRSNALHCMRSYHIIAFLRELLGKAGPADAAARLATADELAPALLQSMVDAEDAAWSAIAGSSMPMEYVPQLRACFAALLALPAPLDRQAVHRMLQGLEPEALPEGFQEVRVTASAEDGGVRFPLLLYVNARLPTRVRAMIEQGLDVRPLRSSESRVRFALPIGADSRSTVETHLRPFWQELAQYRLMGATVTVEVGVPGRMKPLFHGESTVIEDGPDEVVLGLVDQFVESGAAALDLPSSLTSKDRFVVHEYAEQLGLVHESAGTGADRHIVLRRAAEGPEGSVATPTVS